MDDIILKAAVEAGCNFVRDFFRDEISRAHETKRDSVQQQMEAADKGSIQYRALETSLHQEAAIHFETSPEDVLRAITIHIAQRASWSSKLKVSDLNTSKNTQDAYVDLSLYVYARSTRAEASEVVQKTPFEEVSRNLDSHYLIVGPTGAGKSTCMRHLFHQINSDTKSQHHGVLVVLFKELNRLYTGTRTLTIYGERHLLFDELAHILGIKMLMTRNGRLVPFEHATELDHSTRRSLNEIARRALLQLLERLNLVVICDGLDELYTAALREEVVQNLKQITSQLSRSRMIVTSRTGTITTSFDHVKTLELAPLDQEQMTEFARRWLNDRELAERFLALLESTPFKDVSLRPIFFAHLCTIYERTKRIPEKPKSVYRKAISLYLEDWDLQNDVIRMSKYAQLQVDRKVEFLAALAYELTRWHSASVFSVDVLVDCYHAIHDDFGLPREDALSVAAELESQTGLFLRASSGDFEFSHKSLQEYLAASYINSLPDITNVGNAFTNLANEYAIAISLSARPSDAFLKIALTAWGSQQGQTAFVSQLIERLTLERPDFSRDASVAVATSACFSMLFEKCGSHEDRTSLIRLFDKFESILGDKLVLRLIFENYSVDTPNLGNSEEVLQVTMRDPVSNYRAPGKLWIRGTWINTPIR